jgi:hypothetical protein
MRVGRNAQILPRLHTVQTRIRSFLAVFSTF